VEGRQLWRLAVTERIRDIDPPGPCPVAGRHSVTLRRRSWSLRDLSSARHLI